MNPLWSYSKHRRAKVKDLQRNNVTFMNVSNIVVVSKMRSITFQK